MSSISDFRSKVISHGFSKTARYRVVINPTKSGFLTPGSNLQRFTYLCENAELPGRTLNVSDVHYYGASFKSPNQSVYNISTFTFLVTESVQEKAYIDAWMEYINGSSRGYDMSFREDYATTIDVFQLAETETIEDAGQIQFTLKDAFPVSVAPMPISWADDNFHRIMVDFTYTDYSFKKPSS